MKKAKRGNLIVIDGTDGSGKATQADLLVKRLRSKRVRVKYIDFPQYRSSFFGKMVSSYLRGEFGTAEQAGPYFPSILYAADRWQAKDMMNKWLNAGYHVVCNRYVPSNEAHQGGKIRSRKQREQFMRWNEKLEYGVFRIPKPDIVIFLYVPYRIGQMLVDKKGYRKYVRGKKRDIHEKSLNHLKNTERVYQELAGKRKNWKTIKCVEKGNILSRKQINDKLFKLIKKLI